MLALASTPFKFVRSLNEKFKTEACRCQIYFVFRLSGCFIANILLGTEQIFMTISFEGVHKIVLIGAEFFIDIDSVRSFPQSLVGLLRTKLLRIFI